MHRFLSIYIALKLSFIYIFHKLAVFSQYILPRKKYMERMRAERITAVLGLKKEGPRVAIPIVLKQTP